MGHALYQGQVMHTRLKPFHHRFRYTVFYGYFDVDALPTSETRLFKYNRFGLFSFYDRDHGARDGTPLRPWLSAELLKAGIDLGGGAIRLLCYPRVLGFVFNPLSVFFAYQANGQLAAVVYEVKNTFGKQHCYVMPVAAGAGPDLQQHAPKLLHVSPLLPVQGDYVFNLREPGATLRLFIRQRIEGATMMIASLTGDYLAFNDRNLWQLGCKIPFLTFKTVLAIHWQALKLWRRGAKFHPEPKQLEPTVTFHSSNL